MQQRVRTAFFSSIFSTTHPFSYLRARSLAAAKLSNEPIKVIRLPIAFRNRLKGRQLGPTPITPFSHHLVELPAAGGAAEETQFLLCLWGGQAGGWVGGVEEMEWGGWGERRRGMKGVGG